MNIFSAYKSGWQSALKMRKLWWILFGINILFAIGISWPLRSLLARTVGHSEMLNQSLGRFYFPFISDFINEHGALFSGYLNQSFLIVFVYLVFSAFLLGGILEVIVNRSSQFEARHFWGGCGHYFWKLIRLFIYFSLVHIIILIVFWFLFAQQGLNPFKMENDHALIFRLQWMLPLFGFIHLLTSMAHDVVKIWVVRADRGAMTSSIREALGWLRKNFIKTLGIYLINILIAAGVLFMYILVKRALPLETGGGLLVGFILAQVIIIFRIVLKIVRFGSLDAVRTVGLLSNQN